MAIVEWKKDGTVALLIMNNGENRQNPEWCEAMLSTYEEILADTEIKAIVLTSSDPKNFSQGVDTEWVFKSITGNDFPAVSKWLYRQADVFRSMLMAPVPTIAAITGHAFGNGAMLAGACDFRFMRADKGFFCLPEINIGIQMAPSMIEWMKRIMPYPLYIKMQLCGDRIGAAELEQNQVIMKACESAEATLAEAVAFARTFDKSRTSLAEMKRRVYKHVVDKMVNEDPAYFNMNPERVKEGLLPIFMFTPMT
jgi:enoyl-CoA hydratase/carnithine racemase